MPDWTLVLPNNTTLGLTESNDLAVVGITGAGMPPIKNVYTPYGLSDGALWQRASVQPRLVTVLIDAVGTSWVGLHNLRAKLVEAVNPHGATPITIQYSAGGSKPDLYLDCYYDSGLEGGITEGFAEKGLALRLLATDPYWRHKTDATGDLAHQQVTASAEGIFNISAAKAYSTLDGGLHWPANEVQIRKVVRYQDDLIAVGQFYTAGSVPVAVNGIARWDITAPAHWDLFEPSAGDWAVVSLGDAGATGNFTDITYSDIAVDAAGILYVTASGIDIDEYWVVWSWNGAAWSVVDHGAISSQDSPGLYLAVSPQNGFLYNTRLYQGAPVTYGVQYWNGVVWTQVGAAGLDEAPYCLAVSATGNVYVGGYFTDLGGVAISGVAMWNGSTWGAMAAGLQKAAFPHVYGLAIGPDGLVYAGGDFTDDGTTDMLNVAVWDGVKWSPMGSGLNSIVRCMLYDPDLGVIAAGEFDASGSFPLP